MGSIRIYVKSHDGGFLLSPACRHAGRIPLPFAGTPAGSPRQRTPRGSNYPTIALHDRPLPHTQDHPEGGDTVPNGYLRRIRATSPRPHVSSLPHQPWDVHTQAFPSMSWPLVVGGSDWIMKCICEALMAFVQRGRVSGSPERAFYVTNTVDGRCRGTHWISVAISMHWD